MMPYTATAHSRILLISLFIGVDLFVVNLYLFWRQRLPIEFIAMMATPFQFNIVHQALPYALYLPSDKEPDDNVSLFILKEPRCIVLMPPNVFLFECFFYQGCNGQLLFKERRLRPLVK